MFQTIPYDIKSVFKITPCDKHNIFIKTIISNKESFNVLIIDGLYENWTLLRNLVMHTPSSIFNIMDTPNTRNGIDYYDCRSIFSIKTSNCIEYLRHLIAQYFEVRVSSDVKNTVYSNWYYMLKNRTTDFALPHVDCFNTYKDPLRQYTILTFLNNEAECFGGTGFYKNLYLNSVYPVNDYDFDYEDLANICPHMKQFQNNFTMPMKYMQEWEMVDYIPMKPNRTIIFPSNIYHGAYFPTNYYKNIPRINIVTWEVEKLN